MTPIDIDLRTVLPAMRAAFDAQQLEIFGPENQCRYSGPCVIGCVMPEDKRPIYDNCISISKGNPSDSDVLTLLHTGWFTAPRDQWEDLRRLQVAHDENEVPRLDARLAELEAKYLQPCSS